MFFTILMTQTDVAKKKDWLHVAASPGAIIFIAGLI